MIEFCFPNLSQYLKRAMRSADDGRSSVSPHPPVEDEDERDSESDAARSRTSSTAEKTSDVPDIMADMAPYVSHVSYCVH